MLDPESRAIDPAVPASPTASSSAAPDSNESFASDLRALREDAGNPTLLALAARSGLSKSVISEAFMGRRLPTAHTVAPLIEALGQHPDPWVARRNRLAPTRPGTPARPPGSPGETRSARKRWIPLVITGCCAAAVAVAATSLVWAQVLLPAALDEVAAEAATTPTDFLPYEDGVDPMRTICREDAVIAASEERLDGEFQVQMMYSNQCMAVWGRVTRYDGDAAGNALDMRIYPAIDTESSRNQQRAAHDVQSIYTTLMIEPDVDARVCGIATATRDGETLQLGPAMCI